MTLRTTFQIGFRVMKDDLMHRFHKLDLCMRVCVCVSSRPDIPHKWYHSFCHENKTVPWHLLIEGEKSNTDTWKLYLQPSRLHRCCGASCLEPQVFCAIWTNEGSNARVVLERPLRLPLCTHPCIFTFIQQVRSGSILLQCFLHPDNSPIVLYIVVTLFGMWMYNVLSIGLNKTVSWVSKPLPWNATISVHFLTHNTYFM